VGAVHFEMIDIMDTSSFLLAVEQFLAVRPRPSVIIADNGTNFRGGAAALQDGHLERNKLISARLNHTLISSSSLHLHEHHISKD
jgi:hypothetical protein